MRPLRVGGPLKRVVGRSGSAVQYVYETHDFTAGAEQALHDRGVLVIPDFIANAGGVICAAMEYRGATRAAAFAAIEEQILANTNASQRSAQA